MLVVLDSARKTPVAWEEFWVECWYKEAGKHMVVWIGLHGITEILLKIVLLQLMKTENPSDGCWLQL